jgi:[citrate (pro-3S)-lyase] ligase
VRRTGGLFLSAPALLEADCEVVVCAEWQNGIVGCGAIAGNVLKCIAVSPSLQGKG